MGTDDPEAGWGETIDAGEAALPAFQKTQIENNTSVATVTNEYQRFEATEDTDASTYSIRESCFTTTTRYVKAGTSGEPSQASKPPHPYSLTSTPELVQEPSLVDW